MKEMHSRARWLKIVVSVYGPSRGLRSDHHMREGSWSRTRRAGSDYPVFRKGRHLIIAALLCLGNSEVFFVLLSLLSLCFVIIIKYSRAQRETQASYPYPHLSLLL